MKNMEERMREIELSLRNVKLLLREKVAQLKDQVSLKCSRSSEIFNVVLYKINYFRRNIKSQKDRMNKCTQKLIKLIIKN